MSKSLVHEGMRTPWGKADYVKDIAPGIAFVGTPGHGGVKLSRSRQNALPEYMRLAGAWYEEDCEYAIPFAFFAAEIPEQTPEMRESVKQTLRNWRPDIYEQFYGVTIHEGESHVKDERLFMQRHANDIQAVAAVGDWHDNVPNGFVGVTACVGGRNERGSYSNPLRFFLVPTEEYEKRGRFSFIIDPARHQEVAGF